MEKMILKLHLSFKNGLLLIYHICHEHKKRKKNKLLDKHYGFDSLAIEKALYHIGSSPELQSDNLSPFSPLLIPSLHLSASISSQAMECVFPWVHAGSFRGM